MMARLFLVCACNLLPYSMQLQAPLMVVPKLLANTLQSTMLMALLQPASKVYEMPN